MPSTNPTAEQLALVLEIDRVFKAPQELVWRMWSDPEHLVRWHGPEGCALTQCEQDFQSGGRWRRTMSAAPGHAHVIYGEYLEVDPPRRLSFTYTNERDGFPTVVTMDFVAEPDGSTRMLFRQTPFISTEERDGHGWGWNSSFDILSRYLAIFVDKDWGPKGRPRLDSVAEDFAAAKARHQSEVHNEGDRLRHAGNRGVRS